MKHVIPMTDADVGIGDVIEIAGVPWVIEEFGPAFEIDADMPAVLGSHLLGCEGDVAWEVTCRALNSAEQVAWEERRARQAAAAATKRLAARLIRRAEREGTRHGSGPDGGPLWLDGEVLDMEGDRWVITHTAVWLLPQYSGGQIGVVRGAAAFAGYCLPRDEALEATIRCLSAPPSSAER